METEQEDTEPELSPERQKVIALFDPPTIELPPLKSKVN